MRLDRDEFDVTFDPAKADEKLLIATVRKSGYTARVVSGESHAPASEEATVLPRGFPLLDEALARAKAENKPVVIDFNAEWCVPCKKMEVETFADARVKALLGRCIFLSVDTDRQPELSRRLGVVGLPDIRLTLPDGRIVRGLRGFKDAEAFAHELDQLLSEVGGK
jgi:thiol:disulfide interchange protein